MFGYYRHISFSFILCIATAIVLATLDQTYAKEGNLEEVTLSLRRVAARGNVSCHARPTHTFSYLAHRRENVLLLLVDNGDFISLRKIRSRKGPRRASRYATQFNYRGSKLRIRTTVVGQKVRRFRVIESVGTKDDSCRFIFGK
jgi:hypothetical protein